MAGVEGRGGRGVGEGTAIWVFFLGLEPTEGRWKVGEMVVVFFVRVRVGMVPHTAVWRG